MAEYPVTAKRVIVVCRVAKNTLGPTRLTNFGKKLQSDCTKKYGCQTFCVMDTRHLQSVCREKYGYQAFCIMCTGKVMVVATDI